MFRMYLKKKSGYLEKFWGSKLPVSYVCITVITTSKSDLQNVWPKTKQKKYVQVCFDCVILLSAILTNLDQ